MPDIDSQQLAQLATDALERTAFMLMDPAEGADPGMLTHHAKINYFGTGTGEVHVSASEGFVIELASSLLGVEPDEVEADTQGDDAMRELANILAGSLLTQLGAENDSFRLGIPEDSGTPAPSDGCVVCYLESMGEPLLVTWKKNQAEAKAA